ncbi:MAG TPA: endonuclease III [Puia sp.]|nr:endonuclease III [Puia sp.]
MRAKIDWPVAIRPLLRKYKSKRHPLDYQNVYQLLVMVVLSARSTDDFVNAVAPKLFAAFPDMSSLAGVQPEALFPYIAGITNFAHKAKWLTAIAAEIKTDEQIPRSLEKLIQLPGIGRKSANVILREAGVPPEGVIVDVHVLRVAPRLGIAKGTDPKKVEEHLMKILPPKEWDAGMAMSFLGREICTPKPKCDSCLMNKVCLYYSRLKK